MAQIDMTNVLRRIIGHPLVLLIIGTVMVVGAVISTGLFGNQIIRATGPNPWVSLMLSIVLASAATFAYRLFVRFVERKPFTDFATAGALREWAMGAGVGAGLMVATIGTIALFGGYGVVGTNGPMVLVSVLGMAIMSGVWEEIFMRGLLFRMTEQWLGSVAALIISAAFFGFAHITNDNATLLSSVAIALEAGILLAAVYMLTRRLWAAIGLHMAWNFTQGGIFGVAVSGGAGRGLLVPRIEGPELLTGGAFGAEASLPAMIICTSAGLALLYIAWRRGRFVHMSWQRFKTGVGPDTP